MAGKKAIQVQGSEISLLAGEGRDDYFSITDIARKFNAENPSVLVINWFRTKSTIEFLGVWEKLHNPDFNPIEFDKIKNESGSNSFVLSASRWIKDVNAIGVQSKAGRYGGTYAHRDIALGFCYWLSPPFQLYLIQEFQRLKKKEARSLNQNWDYHRFLSKINYRLHTETIREHILPALETSKNKEWTIYANEADLLNMAVFGQTAKAWREANPELAKKGNMRDFADVIQLSVLSNLESLNSVLIERKVSKEIRYGLLIETAISQYTRLSGYEGLKHLE